MKSFLILLFSIVFIQACQEYYTDPDIANGEELIVIEGLITNEPGPYKIRITKTLPYNQAAGTSIPVPVSHVIVSITDNTGQTDTLTELVDGLYFTHPDMKGEPGRTYTLHLITPDGYTYQSEPCIMGMPAALDSLYAELGEITTLEKIESGGYVETKHTGINLYIDAQPSPDQVYYRMETNVLKETSHLEWRSGRPAPPARPPFPTPVYCWEIPAVNNDKDLISYGTLDLKPVKKRFAGFITTDVFSDPNEINDPAFLVGALATSSLYSISKSMYDIFLQLHTQTNPSNGIFDPIPTRIESNITCINEPSRTVLGYFNVAAVSSKTRFFRWTDTAVIVKNVAPNPGIPGTESCKSDVPPDFWINP